MLNNYKIIAVGCYYCTYCVVGFFYNRKNKINLLIAKFYNQISSAIRINERQLVIDIQLLASKHETGLFIIY